LTNKEEQNISWEETAQENMNK